MFHQVSVELVLPVDLVSFPQEQTEFAVVPFQVNQLVVVPVEKESVCAAVGEKAVSVQPRGDLIGIVHHWTYAPVGGLRLRFPFLWFRLERQGHVQQGQQLFDSVAGVQPVAYVAFFGNIREGKQPYRVGGRVGFRGNIQGVSYTGRVVVRYHGNLASSELPVVVLPPFASAHGVAGGD